MQDMVINSIYQLFGYLDSDSRSTMRITNREVNILEYAIKYGGYERYIQTIYGAVKQAFIGRDVALEFDIQLIDHVENNKIVYKKSRADIAYVSDETDSYIYDIEELKCYTSTSRDKFYDQYEKDIYKINLSAADGRIALKYGHAVGFIGKSIGEEDPFNTGQQVSYIKEKTCERARDIVNKLNYNEKDYKISCTDICIVGNVVLCAVVTTLDIRKNGLPWVPKNEMECE